MHQSLNCIRQLGGSPAEQLPTGRGTEIRTTPPANPQLRLVMYQVSDFGISVLLFDFISFLPPGWGHPRMYWQGRLTDTEVPSGPPCQTPPAKPVLRRLRQKHHSTLTKSSQGERCHVLTTLPAILMQLLFTLLDTQLHLFYSASGCMNFNNNREINSLMRKTVQPLPRSVTTDAPCNSLCRLANGPFPSLSSKPTAAAAASFPSPCLPGIWHAASRSVFGPPVTRGHCS